MIKKMKKLTFLVTDSEYASFIEQLRQLGVVHVVELKTGATSPALQAALQLEERYKAALKAMSFAAASYEKAKKKGDEEMQNFEVNLHPITASINANASAEECSASIAQRGLQIVESIERLAADEVATQHAIDDTAAAIKQLEPFGDFAWEEIREMEEATHCRIDFFRCKSKNFRQEWVEKYFATAVGNDNKNTYFVTFADNQSADANPNEAPNISAEHLELPTERLSFYIQEQNRLEEKLHDIHQQQLHLALEERETVELARLINQDNISLARVQLSHEDIAEGFVHLMEGWITVETEEQVCASLNETGIYYEIGDPAMEDKVPIEIKNDSYSSLFEPILKMYSLPNYHDIDPTVLFAPFFMLFFGLCMGDAGYGLLILLVSLGIVETSPANRAYGKLGVYLGATTIVVGLLTGSFFGIDLSKQDWAFLAPFKDLFINETNYKPFGYAPMMVFSIFIGLLQVLLGMILAGAKAVKNGGWKYGIGKFSWVVFLLSVIVLYGLPACGMALPMALQYVMYGFIGLSTLGIMFYNSPDKNIFMNFGSGLWSVYGMATGLLGDLLSYVRLFALGLTGGVLGGVFNQLAVDLTANLPGASRWFAMLIILLFGHGINFGLCMISSFVHPMRLTFVEFFKNADFEGGGKAFTPFKRTAKVA